MIQPLPRHPIPSPAETPLRFGDQPIRAIATDIDGTLTDMQRRLEWPAVEALRLAEAAGIPVILATGNVIPAVKTYQHSIGTTGPLVCENGGTLYWELPGQNGEGTIIHRATLFDRKEADEVVKELETRGKGPRYISSDPWRESEAALELASIDAADVRAAIKDLGKEDLYVVTTGFACHILNKGMNKLEGLRKAIDWLNRHDPRMSQNGSRTTPITLDQVLAIGDSANDIEMLQGVGVGAVVGNAPPEVRKHAKVRSAHLHGDGVADILRRLGLPRET